jgi:hypothetical protein
MCFDGEITYVVFSSRESNVRKETERKKAMSLLVRTRKALKFINVKLFKRSDNYMSW